MGEFAAIKYNNIILRADEKWYKSLLRRFDYIVIYHQRGVIENTLCSVGDIARFYFESFKYEIVQVLNISRISDNNKFLWLKRAWTGNHLPVASL